MRGHLRKRGTRSWAVVVDIGHDPVTGKRRRRWITVKGTKRDAERRLTEILGEIAAAAFTEPSRVSVADYLDQWLRDYVALSVRPRTAQGYRTIVRRLKGGLGRVRLADLKPQHVQRYYANLLADGLSAQTVRHHHRLLSQSVRQAVRWNIVPRNVMERVTPPRLSKPEVVSLSASEAQALLKAAEGTDYYLPIHLALYAGLRRSEVLGLRWSDVDLSTRRLTVVRTMVALSGERPHFAEPKSRESRRTIAFGEVTEEVLRPRRAMPNVQVCARSGGSEMLPDSLTHGFRKIAVKCGLEARFHDLRHAHASLLLESGVPLHVVKTRMGHSSIQTTVDIYGHVMPASDVEAGAVLARRLAKPSSEDKPEVIGIEAC